MPPNKRILKLTRLYIVNVTNVFYVVKAKINPQTIQNSNMKGHLYTFVGIFFEKLNILLVSNIFSRCIINI